MSERYRIVRRLGGGGMAEVFLAKAIGAEGFEKPVAIKRLLPHLAREPEIARMFLSEARLAMHLRHQTLVQVLDLGSGPEGLYLVMELVNGWDLGQIFGHAKQQGAWFPEALAAYVASQIAAGMAHAVRRLGSGRQVVVAHRDITPSNVMLSVDGEVKVADFGIAKVEDERGGTEPGSFKGKVPFTAPEVIRGAPASVASDQFSLGVVLHRMMGGGHPYGHTENIVQYAEQLARAQPPALAFASPRFRPLLARLLALAPEQRYPSWEALGAELGAYLASCGVAANAAALSHYLAGLQLPPTPLEEAEASGGLAANPEQDASRYGEFELDSEWTPQGPALDPGGAVVGRPGLGLSPAPPKFVAPSAPPPADDEPLELAADPRQIQAEVAAATAAEVAPEYVPPVRPRRRRSFFPWIAGAFVLLIAAAAAAVVLSGGVPVRFIPRGMTLPRALQKPTPMLAIDSEPPGATVTVDGVELGQTPLFLENLYPSGAKLQVKLTLRGHRPWAGTFDGGRDARIHATLRRR